MDEITQKAINTLNNPIPLFGTMIRRRGAEALHGTGEPKAVKPLVGCLKDKNEGVRQAALHTLLSLRGEAVDYLCALWAESRDKELEGIIFQAGFIASKPLELRYLTALKQGKLEILSHANGKGIDIILGLENDKDKMVSHNAQKALLYLTNQEGINRLCALWAEERNKELEEIILKAGYIASEPLELRYLTALKQGKQPGGRISWDALETCLTDRDREIAARAVDCAVEEMGKSHEALWQFALSHPKSHVPAVLRQKGWQPKDAAERALFYFLAGDMEAYFDIDFEQSYLKAWYESTPGVLKEAIASRIRESGDRRLLAVFKTERGTRKAFLTEEEAALQAEVMMKNQDYQGLFGLLPFCTVDLAEKIVGFLKEQGWQSPDPREAELQRRLERVFSSMENGKEGLPASFALSIYQDFRPMFLGDLTPPAAEKDLVAWLKADEFRKRSAALITLAERGSERLKEAANAACGDAYWQVRMAAAACEVIRPGTLSPANKALLEQDHVVWVQAMLRAPKPRRLVEMDPAGIEALRETTGGRLPSKNSKPDGPDDFFEILKGLVPTREQEYLLTLAEFLGTDIVVSEETAYEAAATDVEIEIEE